jgi:hypothetical protein
MQKLQKSVSTPFGVFSIRGALSSIMVPVDEPDIRERIYDQTQITAILIERNKTHLGKHTARHSPFLHFRTEEGTTKLLSWLMQSYGAKSHRMNSSNVRKGHKQQSNYYKILQHPIPSTHVSRPTTFGQAFTHGARVRQHLRLVSISGIIN